MTGRKWKAVLLLAGIAACFAYWDEIYSVVMMGLLVCVFVLVLAPVCTYFERKMKPALSAACSVGMLFSGLLILIGVFVPYLIMQMIRVVQLISPVIQEIWEITGTSLIQIRSEGWAQRIAETTVGIVGRMTPKAAKSGVALAAQMGRYFLALILTYYVLRERYKFGMHLLLCVPVAKRTYVLSMLSACRNAVMGYFSGVLKTCLFISGAMSLGLLVLGIPNAVVLAIMMGILELIPYAGPALAAIPILLSALTNGVHSAGMALLLLLCVQIIEGNFVSPYFTASSTSLHPLTVLISIYVGGTLFGIWGILLVVPVVVVIRCIFFSVCQLRGCMP